MAALDTAILGKRAPDPPPAEKPKVSATVSTTTTQVEQKPPVQSPVPDVIPTLPPVVQSSNMLRYVLVGVASLLLLAGLGYFVMSRNGQHQADKPVAHGDATAPIPSRDWSSVQITDPALNSCGDVQACLDRKAQADRLRAVSDWKKLPNNSPLLQDCMAYQPCLDRRAHAAAPVAPVVKPMPDVEELPPCCKDYSDPALCRRLKAKAGLVDCSSPIPQ